MHKRLKIGYNKEINVTILAELPGNLLRVRYECCKRTTNLTPEGLAKRFYANRLTTMCRHCRLEYKHDQRARREQKELGVMWPTWPVPASINQKSHWIWEDQEIIKKRR